MTLVVFVRRPLITVIKHRQHQPQAPTITDCFVHASGAERHGSLCTHGKQSFKNPAHTQQTVARVRSATLCKDEASVKDTNESNETEGKTAPEIYTALKPL